MMHHGQCSDRLTLMIILAVLFQFLAGQVSQIAARYRHTGRHRGPLYSVARTVEIARSRPISAPPAPVAWWIPVGSSV